MLLASTRNGPACFPVDGNERCSRRSDRRQRRYVREGKSGNEGGKKKTNREDLSAIDSKSRRLRLSFALPGRSFFLLRLFSRGCFWVDARERRFAQGLSVSTTLTSSCDYKRGHAQTPWIRITAHRRFVSGPISYVVINDHRNRNR